jgi:hypothetical protein
MLARQTTAIISRPATMYGIGSRFVVHRAEVAQPHEEEQGAPTSNLSERATCTAAKALPEPAELSSGKG